MARRSPAAWEPHKTGTFISIAMDISLYQPFFQRNVSCCSKRTFTAVLKWFQQTGAYIFSRETLVYYFS